MTRQTRHIAGEWSASRINPRGRPDVRPTISPSDAVQFRDFHSAGRARAARFFGVKSPPCGAYRFKQFRVKWEARLAGRWPATHFTATLSCGHTVAAPCLLDRPLRNREGAPSPMRRTSIMATSYGRTVGRPRIHDSRISYANPGQVKAAARAALTMRRNFFAATPRNGIATRARSRFVLDLVRYRHMQRRRHVCARNSNQQ